MRGLDFTRAFRAEEPFDLLINLPTRRFFAESQTGAGDRDDDQRRHGEDRVVSEGCAETQGAIFDPVVERLQKERSR